MSAFIFIESNTTGSGELLVKKVLQRGLTPYFLTADRTIYPFLKSLPVITISIDTTDADRISEFCAALDQVAGVFSSSECFVEVASEVAVRLNLGTGNTPAVRACRDKQTLVAVLGATGIRVPKSVQLPLWEMEEGLLKDLPYPVVIKPVAASGGVNVKRIADAREARAHCEKLQGDGHVHALAQQYVEGSAYSVETLTLRQETRVVAVIKKFLGAEPTFVEIGHSFPAGLSAGQRKKVEDLVVRALDALGFQFGPAHTEVRLHGDEVTIVDISPRLAGGLIPLLLDAVFDGDLLDYLLDVWTGHAVFQDFVAKRYGAVRFAMAQEPHVLAEAIQLPEDLREHPDVKYFHVMRQRGDRLSCEGDFRDRVAAVICAGDRRDAVEAIADRAVNSIVIDAQANVPETAALAADGLPTESQAIVHDGAGQANSISAELGCLFDLNEAHLIMLGAADLVGADMVRRLLRSHRELRSTHYAELNTLPRSRGLYVMLEQYLIETLGEEAAGALRVGRSCNDLNATTCKLLLRNASVEVIGAINALRNSLIFKATQAADQAFPIYSQYQPALPGTVSHQLLAFERALASECHALMHAITEINVCPMGAGAGGGTTLPIDPEFMSKLLGFARPASNSLEAVANRNGVIHFLSGMNAIGVLLSRFAQDLHLWSTVACAFVIFPEAQADGASVLPQKRGPFLLEFIKNTACIPIGCLVNCSAMISKTSYTDSFEFSSQVNRFISDSVRAVADIIKVATALIDGLEINPDCAEHHLRKGAAGSAAVTGKIAPPHDPGVRAEQAKAKQLIGAQPDQTPSTLEAPLAPDGPVVSPRPIDWALSHAFGGGPGSATLTTGIAQACNDLADGYEKFRRVQNVWREAAALRAAAIEHYCE